MAIQINLVSLQGGDEFMELYRLYIMEMKGFKLVDCLETVDLFLWNLNGNMIMRFTDQIFEPGRLQNL